MLYTVPDLLVARDRRTQSQTAIIDGRKCISYAELTEGAARYAALLRGLKMAPGDRVALLLPRSTEAAAAFFGTLVAGGVAVFVTDRLPPHPSPPIISDARPSPA